MLVILSACGGGGSSAPAPAASVAGGSVQSDTVNSAPAISSFTAGAASVVAGTPVRFDWKVADANSDAVSCSFDPMGDGNVIAISDCLATQSASYTYATSGTFQARLTATDTKSASSKAELTQIVTGDPSMTMVAPLPNAVVAKQLTVIVSLKSTFELSSVVARIGNKSVPLLFSARTPCGKMACPAGFSGVLDLSGLPEGEHTLEVIAVDAQGRQAKHSQLVNLDDRPVLTVTSPAMESVATPSIPVSATCTDVGLEGCTVSIINLGTELASGSGGINRAVDLSAFAGTRVDLIFVATDSRGQVVKTTRTVYVENSPNLTPVATVDGEIVDLQDNRLLYKSSTTLGEQLRILDRSNNTTANVPVPAGKEVLEAYLSNYGAMFATQDVGNNSTTWRLYEWNRNTLYDLGVPNASSSLTVSGSYAIWSKGETLIRRNLTTLANDTLSSSAGNWYNDVTKNGVVSWWSMDFQVFLNDGTTSQITNDAFMNTYPRTDGHYTVYKKSADQLSHAIVLFNGTSEVTLRSAARPDPRAGRDYQLRDGWVAYTDLGNQGQTQLWTYDAQGNKAQRSLFFAASEIDTLGDGGRVMFMSGGRRYLSIGSGIATDVSSAQGKSYHINNQWYIAIGRVLFSVNN